MVKVSDFNLSISTTENEFCRKPEGNEKLPVRWMSIESITKSLFSAKSDVASCIFSSRNLLSR